MPKQTPKQKRQATARSLKLKMPANPKVKVGDVVISERELNRIIRDLER